MYSENGIRSNQIFELLQLVQLRYEAAVLRNGSCSLLTDFVCLPELHIFCSGAGANASIIVRSRRKRLVPDISRNCRFVPTTMTLSCNKHLLIVASPERHHVFARQSHYIEECAVTITIGFLSFFEIVR